MVVIIKRPGERAEEATIPNTLKALQKAVGGYIETVTMEPVMMASDIVVICNEEGRIRHLPYNCTFCGHQFYGTIVFCGVDDDGDDFADVPLSLEDFYHFFLRG